MLLMYLKDMDIFKANHSLVVKSKKMKEEWAKNL